MKHSGAVKKLIGAVILAAEAVMFWQIAVKVSPEFLPVWHRWYARLTIGMFIAAFAVSAVLYFFCVIKGKVPVLFKIWAFVCLFLANTLYASPPWVQIVFSAALAVFMIHDGLFHNLASSAVILVICLVCALFAGLLAPAITRVEKPELYTRFENFWWELFLTVTGRSDDSGTLPPMPDPEELQSDSPIPDNMVTNDPFPETGDTLVCNIKSTYPLETLHVFSCGSYDPTSFTFSILDDRITVPGSHSPSANYYWQVVHDTEEYPGKAIITDYRKNKTMMLTPYCTFITSSEGARGFGDRYLYRNSARYNTPAQYTFLPDGKYAYPSLAYSKLVQEDYLGLPASLEGDIRHFANLHDLVGNGPELWNTVAAVQKFLSEEYIYTDTPPALPDGEDPVMWFLIRSKAGHSKHFAAAQVFLYRAAGVPARYSFGYKVREYDDGSADVFRREAFAFCEIFADGIWTTPEEVLAEQGLADRWPIGPKTETEVRESEKPVQLPNGYDISHLKGTAAMFGSYDDIQSVSISRKPHNENDNTVALVVDTDIDMDYIKAYSTGDYSYPSGSFSITADTRNAPDFERGKSFGEYARDAFMSAGPEDGPPQGAKGFRVFNLFAPRHIYAPVFTVSTKGLAEGSPESFGMVADRMIAPHSDVSAYDDYTLFEGGEAAGANTAYTRYAMAKYTQVPDELLYYLRQFLAENDIDPDGEDKGALIESVRTLLEGYTYNTQIDSIPDGKDPVMWFLTESKNGYCVHFAASSTMLLRACGIPARYVTGYFRKIPAGSVSEVTVQDAHAWTEVFDGSMWLLVDMCAGQPAEGQALPEGLDTEELPYTLPSVKRQIGPGAGIPLWLIYGLIAAAACAAVVILVRMVRKNTPDALQKAEIKYKYIKKYYFINDDIDRLLNKISYSREGAQDSDIAELEKCYKNAKSLLLYRHKYLKYAASIVVYAFWYLKACAIRAKRTDF